MLSISGEFLSNCMETVFIDGASREWIPIVSGMPQVSVLGPLLFILYVNEMFELGENRLYAYADDPTITLLAVVRKPADRHVVAASINAEATLDKQLFVHKYLFFQIEIFIDHIYKLLFDIPCLFNYLS